jgi:transmembrane sensor
MVVKSFLIYTMRRTGDISILLINKDFQKILSEWNDLGEAKKAEVFKEYELTAGDVEILRQLWMGLDFHRFEHPEAVVEEALNETVWKLAERKVAPAGKIAGRQFYEVFARIAAILIIPIILYTAYIQFFKAEADSSLAIQQLVTVHSQQGTITKLTLPDGSLVWLNSGSSVSYPNTFSGRTREVSLTGEAYFEVVKNKQMPMVVLAGDMQLKVYGTTFNVNAFSSEPFVKVTLVEGSVSLSSASGKLNDKEEFFIKPGQTVTFNGDSKELVIQNEDPFYYTAWKDGIMVFRNSPFGTVLKRLSCKFNVDIELKDQTLATIPMDARFRDESLHEILRLLSSGTPFRYYYETPRKRPDGTFEKSKIYIEKY